jgi:hypothetical protein
MSKIYGVFLKYYLDVWQPAHQGNVDASDRPVSISFLSNIFNIHTKLNILSNWYTNELKKIHGPEREDPRSVPFNVDVVYAVGEGTPDGRQVNVLIIVLR